MFGMSKFGQTDKPFWTWTRVFVNGGTIGWNIVCLTHRVFDHTLKRPQRALSDVTCAWGVHHCICPPNKFAFLPAWSDQACPKFSTRHLFLTLSVSFRIHFLPLPECLFYDVLHFNPHVSLSFLAVSPTFQFLISSKFKTLNPYNDDKCNNLQRINGMDFVSFTKCW